MADTECLNHKVAIGELLNAADQLSKKVIGAYKPDVSYKANIQNLLKFDATHLEKAITFLTGFQPRDSEDKKLYKNQGVLCDRIILKIESMFDSTCDECKETYRNTLADTPPLFCKLCMQGSHNCEQIQALLPDIVRLKADNKMPIGMSWLCHGCNSKNDLNNMLPKAKATAPQTHAALSTQERNEASQDVSEEMREEDRASPRRNASDQEEEAATATDSEVCENYIKMKCLHGLTGKRLINGAPCPKRHPPRCFRYCKYGEGNKLGCKKGNSCKYLHPRLCRDSVNKRVCLNRECKFVHLKFTRRNEIPQEANTTHIAPNQRQSHPDQHTNVPRPLKTPHNLAQNKKARHDSVTSINSWNPKLDRKLSYGATVVTKHTKKHDLPGQQEKEDNKEYFLMLMENMKEGIIAQVASQISELHSSIPLMIRDQIHHYQPHIILPQSNNLQKMTLPPSHPTMNQPTMVNFPHFVQ